MKCQILFSGKKITNLLSAELAQRAVKVKDIRICHKTLTGSLYSAVSNDLPSGQQSSWSDCVDVQADLGQCHRGIYPTGIFS